MFQKVHLRLTLLCAGITIIILLIMSSGWLYVSEKSLRDNSFISFQNDMNTLVSNLEQQTVISGSWLKNMEGNGKYLIWLLDSGIPFLHNRQNQTSQALYEEACAFLDGQPELSGTSGYNSAAHTELLFHSSATDKDYYACAASLTRGQGNLHCDGFQGGLGPLAQHHPQLEIGGLSKGIGLFVRAPADRNIRILLQRLRRGGDRLPRQQGRCQQHGQQETAKTSSL